MSDHWRLLSAFYYSASSRCLFICISTHSAGWRANNFKLTRPCVAEDEKMRFELQNVEIIFTPDVFVHLVEKMSSLVTGMCQKSILRERGLSFLKRHPRKKVFVADTQRQCTWPASLKVSSHQQHLQLTSTCLCWPHRICKFHFSMNCQVQSYFHSTERLPWWDSFYFSLFNNTWPLALCECVVYNGLPWLLPC